MQKPNWKRALASMAGALTLTGLPTDLPWAMSQDSARAVTVPAGLQDPASFQSTPIQYLPFAHFAIPFEIDRTGRLPQEVHLWVSADQGRSWLKYASNSPDKRSFEFQAAAEGEYLFAVQTLDDRGTSALAAAPPMRIMVDTSKPQLELKADINSAGRLVIDYRITDRFLAEESVQLSFAVDGSSQWEEVRVGRLKREGEAWVGQIEQEMPRCHEIELKIVASDLAQNRAEAVARYHAPRTASAGGGMQLASQRAQAKPLTLGERNGATAPGAPSTAAVAPQLSGPRAAANRMSQLAGAPSATDSSARSLDSVSGGIAWEPTSRRSSAPRQAAAADLIQQSLGRTVSHAGDADATESPNLVNQARSADGSALEVASPVGSMSAANTPAANTSTANAPANTSPLPGRQMKNCRVRLRLTTRCLCFSVVRSRLVRLLSRLRPLG